MCRDRGSRGVLKAGTAFISDMACARLLVLLLAICFGRGYGALQLATYFGDHMVLQRGPQQAVLWGTADTEGDTVTAQVKGHGAHAAQVTVTVSHGKWKLKLPAHTVKGPFTIDVSSADGHVMLHDVLFGDVWLCSGQSNMGFTLNHVINATAELHHALQFPDIRFTRAKTVHSATPQDSMAFDAPWGGPTSQYLPLVSGVCWLFGEYLQQKLNYPIGLVQSAWGGTPVEAWSSHAAVTACNAHNKRESQHSNSALWNAMINPMLSTTLYGAIWYQGEANANHYAKYACQIENMVKGWRTQFHQQSMQQTSASFPFGYVQLAGNANNSAIGGFPGERWAQTANYGYSPNPALPDTFMAVAMDLPDFNSPQGTIHPRFKQDVAERLVLGALNVAYGQSSVAFQGPFPTGLRSVPSSHTLQIQYGNGTAHLDVKNTHGFEVCCSTTSTTQCGEHDHWVAAPISSHQRRQIHLTTVACHAPGHVVGVRYEWRTSPCQFKACSLYDSETGLPAPPYISNDIVVSQGPELIG